MTDAVVRSAGDFLVEVAQVVAPDCDPEVIRTVMRIACGGRLTVHAPDGRRTSGLTLSGLPFEVSLTGGRGEYTPAVRYGTELVTHDRDIAARLTALSASIGDLAAWLPVADDSVVETVEAFLTAIYPNRLRRSVHEPPWAWLGMAHHTDLSQHVAALKVYGSPNAFPGALERLCRIWSGFEALAAVSKDESFFAPCFVAVEVDAQGEVTQKVYQRARARSAAVPMKLVRHFGDPAWEVLSELVRCGANPAELNERDFIVCSARRGERTTFTLSIASNRGEDLTDLVYELAARHHGTTDTVDAMARAAKASHAAFTFSVVGLGFSAECGIDKLNVYGTPTWNAPNR